MTGPSIGAFNTHARTLARSTAATWTPPPAVGARAMAFGTHGTHTHTHATRRNPPGRRGAAAAGPPAPPRGVVAAAASSSCVRGRFCRELPLRQRRRRLPSNGPATPKGQWQICASLWLQCVRACVRAYVRVLGREAEVHTQGRLFPPLFIFQCTQPHGEKLQFALPPITLKFFFVLRSQRRVAKGEWKIGRRMQSAQSTQTEDALPGAQFAS